MFMTLRKSLRRLRRPAGGRLPIGLLRCAVLVPMTLVPLASPALAGELLLDGQVVGVLPSLTTGSRDAAYRRLGAMIDDRSGHNGVLSPIALSPAAETSGFGFAGHANSRDIAVFRLAWLIGSSASVGGDARELTAIATRYAAERDALAELAPELVASFDEIAAGLRAGRVNGTAMANALRQAEEGIAVGPARAHGYAASGLWLGLSMLGVGLRSADTDLAAMAGPLATMLEEDAAFGGADRKIAAELRAIAEQLMTGRADLMAYKGSVARALAVEADAP